MMLNVVPISKGRASLGSWGTLELTGAEGYAKPCYN